MSLQTYYAGRQNNEQQLNKCKLVISTSLDNTAFCVRGLVQLLHNKLRHN
jgi:hypothetical protein